MLTADTLGARHQTSRELNNRFVRDQTVLGLAVYGPAFAAAVGHDGLSDAAAYLVMAGGSFFAAAELTRRVEITEARHLLSSGMALRGAGAGLLIATQADASANQVGAITLLGGVGGTAAGLLLGKGLTGGEAAATLFGHDLAFLSAAAITLTSDSDPFDDAGVDPTSAAVIWTTAGLLGYAGGHLYAANARHNVTVGDVQTLWLSASIGALAGGAAIASSDPDPKTVAGALLAGALVGTVVGERTLVRRFDHTRSEGNLVALGGGAGALMGMGVGILVAGEANRGESLTLGFATLGAVAGVAMTERYLQPLQDAGRLASFDRLSLDPMGIAAVATGRPGRHSLLRFTF